MTLPLAIYTAEHGLAWRGATREIPYSELDACRCLLGPVPDFDSGEPGYAGVAAVGGRVFVIRCFLAEKWDFRGRDSLYLAVTWLPREQAATVNFGALLESPKLSVPLRNPPETFAWTPPAPATPDVVAEMRRLLAEESPDARIRLVRSLAPDGVIQRLDEPNVPVVALRDDDMEQTVNAEAEESVLLRASLRMWVARNAARIWATLAVALTLGLLTFVAHDFFKAHGSFKAYDFFKVYEIFKRNVTQSSKQEETENDGSREVVVEESRRCESGEGQRDGTPSVGRADSERDGKRR